MQSRPSKVEPRTLRPRLLSRLLSVVPRLALAAALTVALLAASPLAAQAQQEKTSDSQQQPRAEQQKAEEGEQRQQQSGQSDEGDQAAGPSKDGASVVGEAFPAQVALAMKGFSPGVFDGKWGNNSRAALKAFQEAEGLSASGEMDDETRSALGLDGFNALQTVTLTEEQVSGPFLDELPESLPAQAEVEALRYTSVEEKLAETFHTTIEALRKLNPDTEMVAGTRVMVPRTPSGAPQASGELALTVYEEASVLEVRSGDEIVFFAPVTSGSEANPLPIGDWEVVGVAQDPTFEYDPSLFNDAPADHEEATLPPGPNNPVGVVWIDLSKEHYGIHGTPSPETIGYAESHGCVRLTNWDARTVASMVKPGTPVHFKP